MFIIPICEHHEQQRQDDSVPYIETVGELTLSPEGETILWIPTAAVTAGYQPPEGAVPMKMSEYWALKERAEEEVE